MRIIRTLDLLIFVSVLISIILSACVPGSTAVTPTAEAVGAQLRIANVGDHPIEDLVVIFPEERMNFGDIAAGETTDYRLFEKGVYNYAAYAFVVDGETVMQPVIDWVGESPRSGEKFTYELDFDAARENMLKIELVQVVNE